MNSVAKALIYKLLPESVIQRLRIYHYSSYLEALPRNEEPDLFAILPLISEGDLVADVGANFGLYTVFLSRAVGNDGRVISIEPAPNTFQILTGVIKRLGCRNVIACNVAASDSDGQASLEIPGGEQGGKNYYQARLTSSGTGVSVKKTTLDQLLNGERVSFIKIDVEGHEPECLAGAWSSIVAHRPALLIEMSDTFLNSVAPPDSMFDRLISEGYRAYQVTSEGRIMPYVKGDRAVNGLFLRDNHRGLLGITTRD